MKRFNAVRVLDVASAGLLYPWVERQSKICSFHKLVLNGFDDSVCHNRSLTLILRVEIKTLKNVFSGGPVTYS